VLVGVRTLVDPFDPADMAKVHALQDGITVEQKCVGTFEVPKWDPVSQKKIRDALHTFLWPRRHRCVAAGAGACWTPHMILGVPPRPGLRIMVAAKPVDFRKGLDSLAALVTQALASDVYTGDVFIFRSKRSDR
jgi:IS66 Orf2 like protein